jgi:hypothetical protein
VEDEMTNRLTRAELLRRAALASAAAAAPGVFAGSAKGAARSAARAANGNKPLTNYLSSFTTRVATFRRTAYYPIGGKGWTAVTMVIDELLVGERAARDPAVRSLLRKRAVDTGQTVFGGLKQPPPEDVHIWRLKAEPGKGPDPDVAALVWDARKLLATKNIPVEQVGPNHVLIPSSNYHTCPGGPPEEPKGAVGTLRPSKQSVSVVVIDSGYVDDGPVQLGSGIAALERGQWFSRTPGASNPYGWIPEPAEPLYVTDPDGRLATLVGHANFVAGVIAQACQLAQITVVNHNGGFIESVQSDTPIPTEASVARSLWVHRTAQVINVGFAFATLPNRRLVANTVDRSGPPSWTFELVLRAINTKKTVVIAPAGNQNCPVRQYPAAFHLNPRYRRNVIGVGSICHSGVRSGFSNYGPWVACCTEGEDVLSSFIMQWGPGGLGSGGTEDAESDGSRPDKIFNSGWARWSGTSFAAPKVAAAIANRVGSAGSPVGAWLGVAAGRPTGLGMGKILSGLPPTA